MAAARAPLIRPRAVAFERLHEASSGGHWTALYRDRAETGIEGGSAPEEQRRLRCCIHCLALQQNGPSPMNSILAPIPYRGDRSSGPMQSHSPLVGTWHRRMALGACAHRACKACAHRRRATARRNCPAPHRHTPPSPLRRRAVSSGCFCSCLSGDRSAPRREEQMPDRKPRYDRSHTLMRETQAEGHVREQRPNAESRLGQHACGQRES